MRSRFLLFLFPLFLFLIPVQYTVGLDDGLPPVSSSIKNDHESVEMTDELTTATVTSSSSVNPTVVITMDADDFQPSKEVSLFNFAAERAGAKMLSSSPGP